ncbi:MAG: hypothetical protein R2797_08760 [Gelidibacter sp.]
MKTLLKLMLLSMPILLFNCSKSDDDGGGSGGEAQATATINRNGTNQNFNATNFSGFYDANRITLNFSEYNSSTTETVSFLLNLARSESEVSGATYTIGDSHNGQVTYASIQFTDTAELFTSVDGSITIDSFDSGSVENTLLLSGSFDIELQREGVTVTTTGHFDNLPIPIN